MKIVEIRGFHLAFPLAEPMGNALNLFRRREAFLTQIVTDDGLCGWGEAGNSPHAAGAFVRRRLAGLVLGQDPTQFGRLHQSMLGVTGYDRRGASMMAIAALDIALHDLAARSYGISVATLLGGALRERIFTYASGPFLRSGPDPYCEYGREVDGYLERGFRAIKPRAGFGPKQDGIMATGLRRRIGPDVAIIVDINQSYTASAAIQSARRMEEADLLWIEEPVQPEDVAGYRAFVQAVPTAVAGGEALGSVRAFRDFLAAGAFSILQPDLSICGGYSGVGRVAALASAHELPVMPHVFGTAVNFYASVQMAAVIETRRGGGPAPYPFLEFDTMDNPLLRIGGPFEVDADGAFPVPTGPGTGFQPALDDLKPWIVDRWSETL